MGTVWLCVPRRGQSVGVTLQEEKAPSGRTRPASLLLGVPGPHPQE